MYLEIYLSVLRYGQFPKGNVLLGESRPNGIKTGNLSIPGFWIGVKSRGSVC